MIIKENKSRYNPSLLSLGKLKQYRQDKNIHKYLQSHL